MYLLLTDSDKDFAYYFKNDGLYNHFDEKCKDLSDKMSVYEVETGSIKVDSVRNLLNMPLFQMKHSFVLDGLDYYGTYIMGFTFLSIFLFLNTVPIDGKYTDAYIDMICNVGVTEDIRIEDKNLYFNLTEDVVGSDWSQHLPNAVLKEQFVDCRKLLGLIAKYKMLGMMDNHSSKIIEIVDVIGGFK